MFMLLTELRFRSISAIWLNRRLRLQPAAGAAIGGMIVLGPIGALGGAFVTGKAVVIPVGSTTYVQTMEDTTIQGMVYQENKI